MLQTTDELIRVGKESYYIVSHFDVFEYRQEAWLFNKLANRFGGQTSSLTEAPATSESEQTTKVVAISSNSTDRSALIAGAAQDLADYQRLTAEGRLAEAGQKLEDLKRKLDQLQASRK